MDLSNAFYMLYQDTTTTTKDSLLINNWTWFWAKDDGMVCENERRYYYKATNCRWLDLFAQEWIKGDGIINSVARIGKNLEIENL